MRFFTVAASGGEAADAADGVSQGEAGGEGVASSQRRHVMFPDIPSGGHERGQQASGKNSAGLQRIDAEDLPEIVLVDAPIVDDVQDLRADNAAEHDQNAQVPRLVAVNAEALGIADADPEADQDAQGDEESVGWKEELS